MRGNKAKVDVRKAVAADKRRMALELRKAGASYQQISDQLGLGGKSNAHRAVKRAILDIPMDAAREVLAMELERLDALLLAVWQKAKGGDLNAVDRVLRIQERRTAYLGLDAPKKQHNTEINLDVQALNDAQIDALLGGTPLAVVLGPAALGAPADAGEGAAEAEASGGDVGGAGSTD